MSLASTSKGFLFLGDAQHWGLTRMPKMKTRKAAAKRFKVTASGKVKYKKQGLRHILTKKSTKRKRTLRHDGLLSEAEMKKVQKMLPYNF